MTYNKYTKIRSFFFGVLLCLTARSDLLFYLRLLFLNGKAIPYSSIFFSPYTWILLGPPLANPRIASSFSASDEVGSWEFGLLQASLYCRIFIEHRLRLAGLYLVSPSFMESRTWDRMALSLLTPSLLDPVLPLPPMEGVLNHSSDDASPASSQDHLWDICWIPRTRVFTIQSLSTWLTKKSKRS